MSSDARVPQSVDSTVEAGRRARLLPHLHTLITTDRNVQVRRATMTWVAVRAFRRRVDDQNAFWQGRQRVYIHMWSRQATKQPRQSR